MAHHAQRGEGRVDTIFAAATPPGRGGVAVIRLSGPEARAIAGRLTGALPPPRQAQLRAFRDPAGGEVLDRGIVLLFPAPASYTGEDVVELQGHGGPAVVRSLLDALRRAGGRLAQPGEFTERAFLNGRMDLSQAEGVAALIEADSEAARRAAMRSVEGAFGQRVAELGAALADRRARLEAGLDFPDEEEPAAAGQAALADDLDRLREQLGEIRARAGAGWRLSQGQRVALVGPPNAGKSSLLNALTESEAAIVAATPGTTRDVIRETARVAGQALELLDTAGLRPAAEQEEVEREGARRARASAEGADALLFVVEEGAAPGPEAEEMALSRPERPVLLIRNKIDRSGRPPGLGEEPLGGRPVTAAAVSAHTGAGLEAVREWLEASLQAAAGAEEPWAARERHLEALADAEQALGEARRLAGDGEALEDLVADALRRAQQRLGAITGAVSSEDLLDRIFSSFCIGK